jgi:predicted ABC-type ATPase
VKEIVIIAGPNGSGKSTLASQLDIKGVFISADDCEKRILADVADKSRREQLATVMVGKEIQESIKRGLSFAFETVFATNTIPTFLKNAKADGYEITLHFVSTESVDINIERVAKRVHDGGHDVPKDKIIERYDKCGLILPSLIEFVDTAYIYDNSGNKIRAFLVKENNQMKTISAIPDWAKNIVT